MPDSPIRLKLAGLDLNNFDGLTVDRNLDSFADSFSFTMPNSDEIRAKVKPREYTPAVVSFGDTPIITGRIEKISTSIAAAVLNLEGRSMTGSMIDCSLGNPSNWSNLTLGYIGKEKAKLYGIGLSLPQGDGNRVGEAAGSPEQSVADFLQGLAQDMGYLWHCNAAGALELIKPTGEGPISAALVEGVGSVQDISVESDDTGMFQTYKVTMQTGGYEGIKYSVIDPGIKIHRFKERSGSTGAPSKIRQAAELDRALAIASSFRVGAQLSSWTNDAGELWTPGQMVTVHAPSCYITRPTKFLIAGVSLSLTSSSYEASLRLILPQTYSGKMPEAFPWD